MANPSNHPRRSFSTVLNRMLAGAFDVLDEMVDMRFDSRRVQAGKTEEEASSFAIPMAKLIPLVSNLTNDLQESTNSLLHFTLNNQFADDMTYQIYNVSIPGA